MYYTEESIEQLKHSIDLVEVLRGYDVHLKRMGSNYKACCPFHEEKTPSFMVNPSGSYYHCYGCGVHGDAIHFLRHHEGMSFVEALETLAKKFGVQLKGKEDDKYRGYDALSKKEHLRAVNKLAETFFRYCLYSLPEGQQALQYLFRRGFSADTIERFHIGYAPASFLFTQAMKEKKISEEHLTAAGLLFNRGFLFAHRIVFPIHDALGHTVGFSSRRFLEQDRKAKYINTSETILFQKSKIFYGLHWSRKRIAKDRKVILVEGQVDCLQMIDAGFDCTLAPQGTAFTEDHAKEMRKLGVDRVYLLLDGDEAGVKAVHRAGRICQRAGMSAMVCLLPHQYDPDAFLLKYGRNVLAERLDRSIEFLEFLVHQEKQKTPNMTPQEQANMIRRIQEEIMQWGDETVRIEYLKRFSSLMQTPLPTLTPTPSKETQTPKRSIKKEERPLVYDKDLVMEVDVIRCWVFCKEHKPRVLRWSQQYLQQSFFGHEDSKKIYELFFPASSSQPVETVSLEEIREAITNPNIYLLISNRDFDSEKIDILFKQATQKILDRDWERRKSEFLARHPTLKPSEREEYKKIIESRVEVKDYKEPNH